jgi:hypothetical protein
MGRAWLRGAGCLALGFLHVASADAETSCESLKGLTLPDTHIDVAEAVAEGAFKAASGGPGS